MDTASVGSYHSESETLEQLKANTAFKEDLKKFRAKCADANRASKDLKKVIRQAAGAWNETIHDNILFIKSAKKAALDTIKADPSFKVAKSAAAGRIRLLDAFTSRWNLSSYIVRRKLVPYFSGSSRLCSLMYIQRRHFALRV